MIHNNGYPAWRFPRAATRSRSSGTRLVPCLEELEARELSQIERALARMKQGSYGLCEYCQAKIPVARLNALPYSTTCVDCQREMETSPGWAGRHGGADWEKVSDSEAPIEDQREVDLTDLEMDLSSNR